MAKIRAHLFFQSCSELGIGSEQTSKVRGTFLIRAYYTTKGIVVATHSGNCLGSVSTCSIRFSSMFRTEPFLTHHKQKNSPSSAKGRQQKTGHGINHVPKRESFCCSVWSNPCISNSRFPLRPRAFWLL